MFRVRAMAEIALRGSTWARFDQFSRIQRRRALRYRNGGPWLGMGPIRSVFPDMGAALGSPSRFLRLGPIGGGYWRHGANLVDFCGSGCMDMRIYMGMAIGVDQHAHVNAHGDRDRPSEAGRADQSASKYKHIEDAKTKKQ
jgi:hypothetical protein